jgi:hypothetical protein
MLWIYIVLLIAAVFLAVLWIQYGLRHHDSLVLGCGIGQVFLGVLWAFLWYLTI